MIVFSPEIKHRRELATLCNARGLVGTAVEIGVHRADFAMEFLEKWKGKRFIGIDHYQPTDQFPWQRNPDEAFARQCLTRYPHAELVSIDFREWSKQQPAESLDEIYIDADHDYPAVRAQIAAAWPLLRPGGLLAGHDFIPCFPGVVRAVQEFSDREQLDVQITRDEPDGTLWSGIWSWYAFKPGAG